MKELQSSDSILHFGGRNSQELQSDNCYLIKEKIKSLDIEKNIKSVEHIQQERKDIVNVS